MQNPLLRPFLLLVVAFSLMLTACGSKEPEQRAAFTQFLQTRIVDKAGVRVPQLTGEEAAAFGDYAAHYVPIAAFNTRLDGLMAPLGELMQKGGIRSLGDVVARREDLKQVLVALQDLQAQIASTQVWADTAKAALKQPDDLKAVYDQAYARTVTQPSQLLLEIVPQLVTSLELALKVADYLDAHQAQVQISGLNVEVTDPAVHAELNALLAEMNAQGKIMMEAQKRLQTLMRGK